MDLQYQCKNYLSAAHLLRDDDDVSPVQIDLLKDLALSFDHKLYKCEDLTSIKMCMEDCAREHFDILFEDFPLETSHSIATTNAADFTQQTPTDTRQLVYGEIEFDSFAEVLRVAMRQLKSRKKFVDLGHGIGKAIMAAVFVSDFKEFHGIEILQGLHDSSSSIIEQFRTNIGSLLTKSSPFISINCASFLSPEVASTWPLGAGVCGNDESMEPSLQVNHIGDWTDADVVFANSTCFPTPLMRQIETMCRDMRPGSRVITFTTSLSSVYFKVIFKKQLFMSWGPATVYIHERLQPSEVEEGRVDRMELLSPRYRKWANPSPFADKNGSSCRVQSAPVNQSDGTLHVDVNEQSRCENLPVGMRMSTATAKGPNVPTLMDKATMKPKEGPGSLSPSNVLSSQYSSTPLSGIGSISSPLPRQSGDSSVWDPDTPTLKNWAREQLQASQSELYRMRNVLNNGISSDSEEIDGDDNDDDSSSVGREGLNEAERWHKQRFVDYRSDDSSSDDEARDNTDLDFKKMNIDRFSFYTDKNGGIVTASDSDDDENDESESSSGDSDIDDDEISANLENYYHVKDDSEDAEDEDDVDELYDDSS